MKIKIFTYITLMLFVSPNMLTAQTTTTHEGNFETTGWLSAGNGGLYIHDQLIIGSYPGYLLYRSNHTNHSSIGLFNGYGEAHGFLKGVNDGSFGIADSLQRWIIRSVAEDRIEFSISEDEKMRINNDGSVLIGTESNSGNHKLAVAGDILAQKIKLGNDSTTYGFLKGENNGNSIGFTDPAERWVIRSSNDFIEFSVGDVLAEKIKLGNDSTTYGFLKGSNNGSHFGLIDSSNRWIIRSSIDNRIEFRVAGEEKMRIKNDGSILIGTQSNPDNHKLAIAIGNLH